ncbi:MAG: glutamate--tRNA ligase [Bacteroidales bacterium]|nr:glutamate--tRNA ligase [Bacteroidales bacterium]
MSSPVRLRFAPSPTGPLHMGGVRTALYNYLFAKKLGGKFILRIEDTDQTRFVPGAEEYIKESLAWCGIKFDEGIDGKGEYGPYRQSERKALYQEYTKTLIDNDWAYYAFDSSEELTSLREQAESAGNVFTYNIESRRRLNNSLTLSDAQVEEKLAAGEAYVIRFKMPEKEEVIFTDLIRGEVQVKTAMLDDKVLFKSDGMPTYHLANIVDDHLMEISHVIRGEEWLPSAPLHVLLYKAFGWEAPAFAHLPIILKPIGKGKLSKRDGDKMGFPVFPIQWNDPNSNEVFSGYREDGYFPDAFINMLALLGWNPGTEQEVFSMEELIDAFSLDRVGKSGSKFDPEKAKWFNQHYLRSKSNAELASLFQDELKKKQIHLESEKLEEVIDLIKERAVFISDFWAQSYFFFLAPSEFNPKVVKKRWKENTPQIINDLHDLFSQAETWEATSLHDLTAAYIEKNELGFGAVMNALRLAIVGDGIGPDLFKIIKFIGRKDTLTRLNYALKTIGSFLR